MSNFGKLSKTARKAIMRQARSGSLASPAPESPQSKPAFGSGMSQADWNQHNQTVDAALNPQLAALEWVGVSSSNVAAGAYQQDFRRMYLRFNSGAVYRYEDVPKTIWQAFLAAPSKGHFVWETIRLRGTDSYYAYSRVV